MKTGHQIIEEALTEAAKLDPMNSPVFLDGDPGVAYQMGLAAGYLHALEMIPDPDKKD